MEKSSSKKAKAYKVEKTDNKVKEPIVARYKKKKPLLKVVKNKGFSVSMMDDASILQLVKTSRDGIKYHQFHEIAASSSFTMEDWSRFLHLSIRSMLRYKKEKKRFDPIQSEKILEIALLYQKGSDVFASAEYFDRWLDSKAIVLGGLRPKSLLDNSFGIRLISDQLGRIEHGVLA